MPIKKLEDFVEETEEQLEDRLEEVDKHMVEDYARLLLVEDQLFTAIERKVSGWGDILPKWRSIAQERMSVAKRLGLIPQDTDEEGTGGIPVVVS